VAGDHRGGHAGGHAFRKVDPEAFRKVALLGVERLKRLLYGSCCIAPVVMDHLYADSGCIEVGTFYPMEKLDKSWCGRPRDGEVTRGT
jgi:hypothetical protein